MKRKFKPLCITGDIELAITNRNQLLPCCYVDNPEYLQNPTLKKLVESSEISKHNSLADITNNKHWVDLYNKLKEASESQDTKNIPEPCAFSCSREQRKEEWLK